MKPEIFYFYFIVIVIETHQGIQFPDLNISILSFSIFKEPVPTDFTFKPAFVFIQ